MVDDVGANEERPDDGRIFREVGVLGPVDDAGDEVGEGGDEDDLERGAENREEQVHGDGWIFDFVELRAGLNRCGTTITEAE